MSPLGGEVPVDPFSLKFAKQNDIQLFNNGDFNCKALKNTLKPSQINPEDYFAIYYTGGHGVLWDFRDNKEIQDIALKIYQNGGYLTAVCHGVVGLLNLKKADDSLIKDKRVTGFTNTEEVLSGKFNKVPYLTENELKNKCSSNKKTII